MYIKIVNNYAKELVCNLMKKSKVRVKILILSIIETIQLAVLNERAGFTREDNINDDKEVGATNNETLIAPSYSNNFYSLRSSSCSYPKYLL